MFSVNGLKIYLSGVNMLFLKKNYQNSCEWLSDMSETFVVGSSKPTVCSSENLMFCF